MSFIKSTLRAILMLAAIALLAPASTSAQASVWQKMAGGEGTACSDGSPYSFYVHPGDGRNLLIYFQGGGACWSDATCDPQRSLYRPNLTAVDPAAETGIFDFSNSENPFGKYFVVFVPYCTGDVHLGNRTATYVPGKTELHHKGFVNAMSAVQWAFDHVSSPQSVFVAGGSAGAMASPFYAGRVADHYKRARVVQLGDSAGGIGGPAIPGMFDSWGTAEVVKPFAPYQKVDLKKSELLTLYLREGLSNKSIIFAQFNNSADSVQLFGLKMFGIKTPLNELLEQNYAQIRSAVPRFRTFTAPGNLHVILNRPEFYTVTVEGRRLRDWVADLAGGKAPADVPK